MSANAFIGIDGGGTKTEFILSLDGKDYKSLEKTIHPKQISKEEFVKRMENGVNTLLKEANIVMADVKYSFIAIPGFGQLPEYEDFLYETCDRIFTKGKYRIGNDSLNAWAGSLAAKEGINLILGTGSIGYGRDKNGNDAICGGWGPVLGDEASAYYIGNKILNLFTKMSDGRIPKTSLYQLVKDELSIVDDMEIISKTFAMKRDEIANLSKILPKALKLDDKIALEILEDIGKEAAMIIDCLIEKLDFERPVQVSYSGGVYKMGDILLDKIKENVKYPIRMQKPIYSPLQGSLLLAKIFYKESFSK